MIYKKTISEFLKKLKMFCYAQDYEPPSNVFSNYMEIEQANIKQSRIIPLTIPSMQERREVFHVTDNRQTK